MAPGPQRRDEAHRKRHLDASVVPVEQALLHRAAELEREAQDPENESAARLMDLIAGEFRDLAEELHYW